MGIKIINKTIQMIKNTTKKNDYYWDKLEIYAYRKFDDECHPEKQNFKGRKSNGFFTEFLTAILP